MGMPRVQRRAASLTASAVAALSVLLLSVGVSPASASNTPPVPPPALSAHQQAVLRAIAHDTWAFFADDVDPHTALPLDNLGPGSKRGTYTSAANIGVYLWAVVAASDLKLISRHEAVVRVAATLREVAALRRSHGLLFQWYDTSTGHVIRNPGDIDCTSEHTPAQDNCWFLSAVDNGWYASGLMVARQALPEVRSLADPLFAATDFSIFYDGRQQTKCNVNARLGGEPTDQMYGGYYVRQGPAGYHNGALYSDPRIAMYVGMGKHQMPGDVWWRTWRTLPPKQCASDPDNSTQGQWPPEGHWATIHDPQSGKAFQVWEGHYTYPGTDLTFVPTFGGGMFEALMANEVVPETTWGTMSFGAADARTVQVQINYARHLGYPVWGMSPSSTADDTGGYGAFGAGGQAFATGDQLALCPTCPTETTVTPHASFLALDVAPQQAFANIQQLRRRYPDSYRHDGGFFDAVDPRTGAVGHRRLVLDQSMIMASLDNALTGRGMQRWFAQDPASWAAQLYLSSEDMSLER